MDRMIAEAARNQAIAEGAGGIPAGAYESNTDAIPDPEPATSMGEAAGDDADEEDAGGGGDMWQSPSILDYSLAGLRGPP